MKYPMLRKSQRILAESSIGSMFYCNTICKLGLLFSAVWQGDLGQGPKLHFQQVLIAILRQGS
jgi:hypothetical protein